MLRRANTQLIANLSQKRHMKFTNSNDIIIYECVRITPSYFASKFCKISGQVAQNLGAAAAEKTLPAIMPVIRGQKITWIHWVFG